MKNFLLYCLFITLSIIVNSCEEGYKDESTQFSLVLKEITAVPSLTTDTTPDYTFSSNIAGTSTYGGSCSSSTTTVNQGNNTITLDSLSDGTYSDCTITVDTTNSWLINSLTMSSFTIDTTAETLLEVTAVTTPTNDTTPNYTFSTNEAGTITYGGSCSSSTTSATPGNNPITLNSLSDGTYSDCTITVTDSLGHASSALSVSTFVVDTTAPSVDNFTLSDYHLKAGETATVTLVFSEVVASFEAADITADTGTLGTMTSSNNITWTGTFTPTANTEEASNTLSLAASWTDTAGNAGTDNTTANYEVDTLLPSVSSIVISSASGIQNNFLNAGDNVSVTATFREAVIVDNSSGNPTLTLVVGSDNRTATYTSGDNSTELVFRYTIQAGDNDSNGISIRANALDDNSSTIRDPALNDAILTHSAVDNNSSYKVDNTLPTVSSVAITGEDGIQNSFLNAVDNVSVTATFSETVIVDNSSGNPTITLVVGSDNRTATYTSGDNSTRLVFRYMIKATGTSGENDDDGISIPQHALALDNGTIKDLAGNNATLTHSLVSDNSSVKVDTTAPSVDNFTISDTLLTIGETMAVTLVFSEAVCTDSSDCSGIVFSSDPDITVPDLDNGTTPGTLSTMTSSDNETWRGTFTPRTNTEDDNNTLSLATTYTDLAGNNGPDNQTENFEIDTLAPTVSVAITGEDGIQNSFLNAGDNVSVTATFSETVNVSGSPTLTLVVGSDNRTAAYISGDNSTELVFRYMIDATGTSGENDSNGISIPENALALNSGTIRDAALNDAILTHSVVDNNSSYKVDTVLPTVSVAITGEDGIQNSFLNAGDNVSVTATFSETVNVSGSPTLTLVVGSDNRTAAYISGDNSTELVFRYTIDATGTSGENDSNGISIGANALALNSGTIRDAAGNIATDITHSAVDNNSSYKVDTTAPTANFTAATDNVGTVTGALTSGNTTDDTALVLSGTNESGSSVKVYNGTTELDNATVSGTNWSYSATVAYGTTYQFNVKETDLAGNTSNATNNFAVTGDTTPPTVSSVAITSAPGIQNNLLNVGDNVSVTATFSENSPVTGTPQLTLAVGSDNQTAMYASGDNATLVFEYTIQAGDNDSNGISIRANALALNNGTIRDLAGNNATLTHSVVDNNSSYKVDTTLPTVSSVAITSAEGIQNSFLNAGDNVSVTVTFSENVPVTNTPQLTLAVGDDNRTADYASSGIGGTTLVFQYMIQAGDNDSNGISIRANALALNNGTIRDLAGNNATLTHSAVDNNSSYKVDTTLPTVSNVAFSSELTEGRQILSGYGFLNEGDNVSVTATFSERVIVDNSSGPNPTITLVVGSDNRTATYTSAVVLSWCSSTRSRRPGHQERMTPMASASRKMPLP